MTPSTPEGPAATRCERCARERGYERGQCFVGESSGMIEEIACLEIGYSRVRARLVEVERERDAFKEGARVSVEAVNTAMKRLDEAESRANAAEGALRELRQQVEDTIMVAQKDVDSEDWITAYHFKTGAIHRLLAKARDLMPNHLALSGLPPRASETVGLEVRAFARLVELLLDEAQDTIMVRARQTGQQRLFDMAREAAKLCAVARDMQIVNAVGPRLGTDGVGTAVGRAAAAVPESSAQPAPAALVPKEKAAATPMACPDCDGHHRDGDCNQADPDQQLRPAEGQHKEEGRDG